MTSAPLEAVPPDPDQLGSEALSRLLQASVDQPGRPVDDVIGWLAAPDGAAWMTAALDEGPIGRRGGPATLILQGAGGLDELRRIKDESKALVTSDDDLRAVGVLSYFLALAAALVHHGRLISGREREEVNEALVDLSDAAPAPWGPFLLRAAMAGDTPGDGRKG